MNRGEKLVKNTIILAFGTILPRLTSLITLPILTACLTKEEYGLYDLFTILVSLVLPVVTLQIQAGAFRFLIDVRNDINRIKTIISSIFAFILLVSIVTLIFLFNFLPGEALIRVLICNYFLVDILLQGAKQIVRGLEKNLDFSLTAVITAVSWMVFVAIFVLYLKKSILGVVISLLLSAVVSFIFLVVKTRLYAYINWTLVKWHEIRNLLEYSWPLVPNGMAMWAMGMSDRLIVTMTMGLAANAVYAVANKIPSIITLAQRTFSMAWQENASIVRKDADNIEVYYSEMFKNIFDFSAGLLGLILCAIPLLFLLLVRGDYAKAYPHMPILLIALFFYIQCTYLGGIYVAYKKTKNVGITTTIAAIIKTLICLTTINWLGLYAASGSSLISFFILLIYRMIDIRNFVKIKYDLNHMFVVIGILIVEAVLFFAQSTVLNIVNVCVALIVFYLLNKSVIKMVLEKLLDFIKRKKDSDNPIV